MVSAYEISPAKRVAQVGTSVLSCLLVGGVIFGFTALKPILVAEGVYAEACTDKAPCLEQDVRINFIFTAAATATNVVALPVGATLDHLGPRKTTIAGGLLAVLANFIFGWVEAPFDNYVVGFTLLAIAGPLTFLPCFQLSNAFPYRSGLILSAITGAFDASSLPYTAYKEVYQRSSTRIDLKTFFWGYMAIGVAILVQQLFLGQDEPYDEEPAPPSSTSSSQAYEPTERTALLDSESQSGPRATNTRPKMNRGASSGVRRVYKPKKPVETAELSGEQSTNTKSSSKGSSEDPLSGMLYGQSATAQIFSSWFAVLSLFLCIMMVRINFYIATTGEQLLYYTGDAELTAKLVTAFVWLLPLGGLVAIPFSGYLLDATSSSTAYLTLGLFATLFGLCTLSPATWSQLLGIGVFVVLRPFFYTAISDFAAKCFGFATFGRVYGLANTISGVFNLVQWPIDLLVKYKLGGNFTPVNVALLVVGALSCLLVSVRIQLGVKNKQQQQQSQA